MFAKLLAPFLQSKSINEQPFVFELCRILFGLTVLHQSLGIWGVAVLGGEASHSIHWFTGITSIAGVMLALGFFTPLALGWLFYYYGAHPVLFNLGNMVSEIVVLGLILVGAGRLQGIDRVLLRVPGLNRLIQVLYFFSLPSDAKSFAWVRCLMLWLFWGLCLSAVSYHAWDPLWLKGDVLQLLFTTTYLTDHYSLLIDFRNHSPRLFDTFCQWGLGIQVVWELFLFPLVYFRWGRIFVVVQGILFFTMSLFFMNLGYLPWVELILWCAIFGRPPATSLSYLRKFEGVKDISYSLVLRKFISHTVLGLAAVTVIVYQLLNINWIPTGIRGDWTQSLERTYRKYAPLFMYAGQGGVNVMNQDDLSRVGQGHFVVYETDDAGKIIRIVPWSDHRGGRLDYLRSD